MTVTLRPAEPTPADAGRIAWGLEVAGDGLFRVMLGANWEQILAGAVLHPGHDLSFEHATLAVDGHEVVGFLHGLHARDMADPDGALRRAAGWWPVLRAGLVQAAGRPLFRAMDSHARDDWYLQAVTVSEARRGAGIGSLLLATAADLARRSGALRLTLDVDATNTRARRLYERHGFTVVATSRPAVLIGGLRVHRMERDP